MHVLPPRMHVLTPPTPRMVAILGVVPLNLSTLFAPTLIFVSGLLPSQKSLDACAEERAFTQ